MFKLQGTGHRQEETTEAEKTEQGQNAFTGVQKIRPR